MRKPLGILIIFALGISGVELVLDLGPLRAAASAHQIVYTWTASTSSYAGLGYNVYLGTKAGGESATPANASLLLTACTGTSCTATITAPQSALIVPNASIFAIVEACVGSTCSAPSNEVQCTIPFVGADIAPPSSLGGVPF